MRTAAITRNTLLLTLTLCLCSQKNVWAFSPSLPTTTTTSRMQVKTIILNQSSSSNTEDIQALQGVGQFEQWFQKATTATNESNNNSMKLLRHGMFSNGRGLEFIGKSKIDIVNNGKAVISLPKDLVLQSPYVDNKDELDDIAYDWDVNLSLQLLKECKLGDKSSLYGYCSLLTQGVDFNSATPCPPSTAPDALRNWSDDEKAMLASTQRGERLLRVGEKQDKEWKDKYNSLSISDRNEFTFEQFQWAMEAVNSRAFKGDFSGQDTLKSISKALVPFAAGALALNYIQSSPFGADENMTFLLLLVACAPVVLNFMSENLGGKKLDAVMLPFIDSANHKESAQSDIAFDPLSGSFTVAVEGNSCFEKDGDKDQFYISYGQKRDTELLLNYGFLNGMKENYESREDRRKLLAEIFNSRSLQ